MSKVIKIDRPFEEKVIKIDKPFDNVIKIDRPFTDKVESPTIEGAFRKAQEIGEGSPWYDPGRIMTQIKRKASMPTKGLIGDIPYSGAVMPKNVEKIKPRSGLEKGLFGIPKLIRDFYAISKIAPLRGLRLLGAAGAYGGLTSDEEKPKEIAKEAGKTAAFFGATNVAFKSAPKAIAKVYSKLPPFIRNRFTRLGQALGTSIKRIGKIESLKFKRRADIKLAEIEGEKFARTLETQLSKQERELLPFLMEPQGIPKKLGRPDLINLMRNKPKREALQKTANQLKGIYAKFHHEMTQLYGDDIGFIKDYINRLWEIPKNKEKAVLKWFATKNPHLKQRAIKTIQEGVNKFGLKPRTLDAADLFRVYNNTVTETMANVRMVRGLRKLKSYKGEPLIKRADKAPKEWGSETLVDHPALRRGLAIPAKTAFQHKGQHLVVHDKLIINKIPVKVHPDILPEIEAIFGRATDNAFYRAIDGVNAFAKHSQLALSLFHYVALTEAALSVGSFSPRLMLKSIRMMKKGKKPILNSPLAKEWIPHGVEVGAPTDIQRNFVESSLMAASDNLKRLGKLGYLPRKATQTVNTFVKANNRFLWDYYHPLLKLYSANKLYHDALKMKRFAKLPKTAIKREIAQFVNDTFGGQSWELLAKSPEWQKIAHRILLSPDWNLSTVRQALSVFGMGARSEVTKGLRQELGSNFWKNGMVILFTGINNLNKSFTKFYLGESKNMWENDPGHETHLFLGHNQDGTKRYLRWGKQFRELPEMFMAHGRVDPVSASIKKVKGKLSPVIQMARSQFDPYPYGKLAKSVGTKREPLERAKELGSTFLPFSFRNTLRAESFDPLSFAFPVSRGMTYYKTKDLLKEAIRSNNKPLQRRIVKGALENGLEARLIFESAFRDIEYEKSGGYDKAEEIYKKLQTVPEPMWPSILRTANMDEDTQKKVRRLILQRKKAKMMLKDIKQGKLTLDELIREPR